MVPHLKDIGLQVRPAVHKVALGVGFHVAGEEEARGAVVYPQDKRGIIRLAVLCHRPQQGDGRAAQLPDGAHCGHLHLQALLLRVFDKILEALGGGIRHRAVDMVGREVGQRSGQTAHMILVGVGAEDVLQFLHALILQVADHHAAIVHIAAVVKHVLPVALHQNAQRLSHIEEVHLEAVVGRGAVGLGCAGRVRDDIGAAAGHHRGNITGGQPQCQRRRQRKSRKAAEGGSPKAYFFRFVVFHVVFSFC